MKSVMLHFGAFLFALTLQSLQATAVLNSRRYVQVRSNFSKPTGSVEFGTRLALSKNGNTLAACASIFGSPPVQNSTYWSRWAVVCPVYVRDTSNSSWTSQGRAPFYTSLCKTNSRAMAFSSDATTLVMAATHYLPNGTQWAQAKIYVRNVAGGYVVQKLLRQVLPRPEGEGVEASVSLSADGNYLALGAETSNQGAGGALVYWRRDGEWGPSKILLGSGAKGLRSGARVAMSGDGKVLAVASFVGAGTVWIFSRTGNTWSETDKLAVSTTWVFDDDWFGPVALSFDGTTLAIGGSTNSHSFMVFRNVNRVWLRNEVVVRGAGPVQKPPNYRLGFGFYLDLSDDGRTLVAASSFAEPIVFFLQNGVWVQDGDVTLTPSNYGPYESFAISGDGSTIAKHYYADLDRENFDPNTDYPNDVFIYNRLSP